MFVYLVVASLLAGGSIWYSFGQVVGLARELGDKASAPMLLLAGSTLLFISALVWIARILVRIYFDERQRSLDAFERSTMAETYSALTHEGLVTPTERIVALTALFRPSSDGSGRDDGAPEALHQALLAKLMDQKQSN